MSGFTGGGVGVSGLTGGGGDVSRLTVGTVVAETFSLEVGEGVSGFTKSL